jgi:hypothetical protein
MIQNEVELLNDMPTCCKCHASRRLTTWCGSDGGNFDFGKVDILSKATSLWRGSIIHVERMHAGNKRRASARHGKPRALRRQAAQFLIHQLKDQYMNNGGRDLFRNLSGCRWSAFADKCKKQSKRVGVGGNSKYKFIAGKAKEHNGLGISKHDFDELRRQWALEFDNLPAAQQRQSFLGFRADVRSRQVQARALRGQDLRLQVADNLKTHWDMGCPVYPIREELVKKFHEKVFDRVGSGRSRGGLRIVAEHTLLESSLVVEPFSERLVCANRVIPCSIKHPGYCTTVDLDIKNIYNIVLGRLRACLPKELSGSVLFRCRFAGPDPRDDHEVFFFYTSFSGAPKYQVLTLCIVPFGEETLEFPFRITCAKSDSPMIPIHRHFDLHTSTATMSVNKMAVQLARRVKEFRMPLVLEQMKQVVGDHLAEFVVSGANIVCEDLAAVAVKICRAAASEVATSFRIPRPKQAKRKRQTAKSSSATGSDPMANILSVLKTAKGMGMPDYNNEELWFKAVAQEGREPRIPLIVGAPGTPPGDDGRSPSDESSVDSSSSFGSFGEEENEIVEDDPMQDPNGPIVERIDDDGSEGEGDLDRDAGRRRTPIFQHGVNCGLLLGLAWAYIGAVMLILEFVRYGKLVGEMVVCDQG